MAPLEDLADYDRSGEGGAGLMLTPSSSSLETMLLRGSRLLQESTGGASNGTSPAVFWGVNAFIFLLVLVGCTWCCCMAASMSHARREQRENGNDDENDEQLRDKRSCHRVMDCILDGCFMFSSRCMTIDGDRQQSSDEAYRQAVLRRRQRELEARRDSPEQRKRKLVASFKRCGNYMVVEASDIITPDDQEKEKSIPTAGAEAEGTAPPASPGPVILDAAVGIPLGEPEANNDDSVPVVTDSSTYPVDAEAPAADANAEAMATKDSVPVLTEAQAPSLIASLAAIFGGSQPQILDNDPEVNEENDAGAVVSGNGESATGSGAPSPGGIGEGDDDQEENASTGSSSSDMTNTDGYIILRNKGDNPKGYRPRRVPNCCAICLCPYEVGETVVWAHNPGACPHAYHEECILDWLVKLHQVQQHNLEQNGNNNNNRRGRRGRRNDDGDNNNNGRRAEEIDPNDPIGTGQSTIGSSLNSTPCPCCRADFTDMEKYRKQSRIKWGAGNAFDPSTIAWR